MQLKNPFSNETRNLYLYRYDCDKCGSNQMLELHHICGRVSNSPLNASLVCHDCHSHLNHNEEEEKRHFNTNLAFLLKIRYKPTENDIQFLKNNSRLLKNNKILQKWLNN